IIEGFIDLIQKGYQVELIDGVEDLSRALEKDVAVVVLSHVNYRTGYFYDMATINEQIHS
ncbi:kynureninase, partial [Acinetobacter baumannii]|nr:kynureninase [Acinetobacter baumannii]